MTDHDPLERRYRRLLALYPKAFRAAHEDEMVGLLLQTARSGRQRPTLAESSDLARHAVRERVRHRMPGDWERAHARVMFPLRIAIASWLCLISALLVGYDRGQLWLVVLVPAIALHLYIAFQLRPGAARR